MDPELRHYNRKHLILFCGVMGLGVLMIIAILLFPNKPTKAEDSWCPNEMVTITRILAKKNYDGVTLELDNGVASELFKKLPFVEIHSRNTDKTYQGYVFNANGSFAVKFLEFFREKQAPLCVTHARLGVFVLSAPAPLK